MYQTAVQPTNRWHFLKYDRSYHQRHTLTMPMRTIHIYEWAKYNYHFCSHRYDWVHSKCIANQRRATSTHRKHQPPVQTSTTRNECQRSAKRYAKCRWNRTGNWAMWCNNWRNKMAYCWNCAATWATNCCRWNGKRRRSNRDWMRLRVVDCIRLIFYKKKKTEEIWLCMCRNLYLCSKFEKVFFFIIIVIPWSFVLLYYLHQSQTDTLLWMEYIFYIKINIRPWLFFNSKSTTQIQLYVWQGSVCASVPVVSNVPNPNNYYTRVVNQAFFELIFSFVFIFRVISKR